MSSRSIYPVPNPLRQLRTRISQLVGGTKLPTGAENYESPTFTGTGSLTFSKVQIYARSFSITGVGTPSVLGKLASFYRSFSLTGSGTGLSSGKFADDITALIDQMCIPIYHPYIYMGAQ